VKGVHSLGQQVEKNRDYGWNCCWSCKILKFYFYEYYDVNLYMYFGHGVVHRGWCTIVGEGECKVKEKREQRQPQVGFSRAKPQERVESYKVFRIVLEVMYMQVSVETGTYTWVCLRKGAYTSKSVPDLGHTTRSNFARFVCSCISLSGPLSLLRSPDFIIIKSSQYWFSLRGFSRGIYPKILVFMCA
jgi:hypothetical protein